MTKSMLTPGETRTCPVCLASFIPRRADHEYCTKKCISKKTYNSEIEKYRKIKKDISEKPENKLKNRLRHRKRTLKKFNLEEHTFESLLVRQNHKCLTCKQPLTDENTRIDHNHSTNRIRGLLCQSCNIGLGLVKEDPQILSNFIAYIDRDASKRYVYIIGALKNENIPHIANDVRKLGYEVFDQWWGAGPSADIHWQEYSKIKGLSYKEALQDYGAKTVFNFDRSHLEMSDIGILILPAGKSGHLELGYLSGLGKKTYILCDGEPDRYDVMPQFANQGVFYKEEDLLESLRNC